MRRMKLLKKVSTNKMLHYIFSRYLIYLLQFINSMFIAVFLGPFFLGVWGFINLVIQYFGQLHFGIANSFNVLASIKKNEEGEVSGLFNTSFVLFGILSVFACLFFFCNDYFKLGIGSKYGFSGFSLIVCLTVVLNYFVLLFSNLFRIFGKLSEITFSQLAMPILMTLTFPFFKGSGLLTALVYSNLISSIISLVVFFVRSPVKVSFSFKLRMAKLIQSKGIYLFLYTTAFYFIIISTRSFISFFYTVEEFGYFTFAFSLANAILMLLDSFSFLILPKLINRLANRTRKEAVSLIEKVRSDYITVSHLLVHIVILSFPLFLYFFPKYLPSQKAFRLCALAIVLYTNCFGYQALLLAKGKERLLGKLALIVLIINLITCFILTKYVHVAFFAVILSTIFSYVVFVSLIVKFGKLLLLDGAAKNVGVVKSAFPLEIMLPYIASMTIILCNLSLPFYLFPLCLFLYLNRSHLRKLEKTISQIVHSPNLINI